MKIAVTSENNKVFQHFGHTPGFAVFETQENKIISETFLPSGDAGHGALAALLKDIQAEVLICGGIGPGAINALNNAGIRVVGGASGEVRKVVEDYLNGTITLKKDFRCNHHHDEKHTCSGGSCSH